MTIYKFSIQQKTRDPRNEGYLQSARALGFCQLKRVECIDLRFIEGQLTQAELRRLALELLSDPLTQSVAWDELPAPPSPPQADTVILEVSLRPGVTDSVAAEIVRAARQIGIDGVRRAATGQRYILRFDESVKKSVDESVYKLFANSTIQRWALESIEPTFPEEAASSGAIETIPIRALSDDELLALSKERRAALDLAEMQAIRAYCKKEGRDLSDVEFETIAQTWSEHCVHKTFKALITVEDKNTQQTTTVDSIIKTYLKSATDQIAAPWVRSAFVDNAGIIDFDDEFEISFKAETHNHPSAVEPFGGANTGVGGVIRDVLGVSAKPIANTDVLCFGKQDIPLSELPAGVIHPQRILSGVVAGVQDYGNKIGVPTVNGAILFDEGYAANPLVFCGCVGIAPKGLHHKNPQAGDRVIILGGRTGRDGLRGATFSSMTMDAQTGEAAGASVQIGDPIIEKGLIDVIVRARDLRLYNDITDCGAGGLSSAVGEMSAPLGCDVELKNVRLKYAGLAPWEIWLSEAQERMVLAVAPQNVRALQEICDAYNVELTDIGAFAADRRLVVRYDGVPVADLDNDFLHEGIPQQKLRAVINQKKTQPASNLPIPNLPISDYLLRLLAHPNIASKASVVRLYDHEIQGGSVVKPLSGVCADAPSDAAVIKPIGTKGMKGIVLANGVNPEYGKRDAYRMALAVADEAVRNAVAVGADPERIAILDNFCWGDPKRPETLGALLEAARGCRDAALLFQAPFISGKDSLNNEYLASDGQRRAIPPTLLISALGVIEDVSRAVTMDLKESENEIYLVGKFDPVFGGSHFNLVADEEICEPVPQVADVNPRVYQSLHRAIHSGLIRSAHDLSEGGLAVAAAEMCIGGRLGMHLSAPLSARDLFGETTGCLLVEISPKNSVRFAEVFADLPVKKLGRVIADETLNFSETSIPLADLIAAFNTPLVPNS
ncbi:MAG: phosphoribosylformylglycinamidine synthase subunit PurL [Anaerolineales bacterium]|nr:phosphoribosylformylglycinamidine synthase subunit PurL [Anaerolineales bacterium]